VNQRSENVSNPRHENRHDWPSGDCRTAQRECDQGGHRVHELERFGSAKRDEAGAADCDEEPDARLDVQPFTPIAGHEHCGARECRNPGQPRDAARRRSKHVVGHQAKDDGLEEDLPRGTHVGVRDFIVFVAYCRSHVKPLLPRCGEVLYIIK
jgi:hypothetical protein